MASSAVKLTALSDAQLLQLCKSENPELCPSSFAIKYSGSKFILRDIASVNRTSTISGPAFKETICRCLHFLNFPKQVIDQPLKCDVKDLMQKVGNLCEEGIQYNLPEAFLQRDDVHHKLVRFCSSIGAAYKAIPLFLGQYLHVWGMEQLPFEYSELYQRCKIFLHANERFTRSIA